MYRRGLTGAAPKCELPGLNMDELVEIIRLRHMAASRAHPKEFWFPRSDELETLPRGLVYAVIRCANMSFLHSLAVGSRGFDAEVQAHMSYNSRCAPMAIETYLAVYQLCGWEAPGEFKKLLAAVRYDWSQRADAVTHLVRVVKHCMNFVAICLDPLLSATIGKFCFGLLDYPVFKNYWTKPMNFMPVDTPWGEDKALGKLHHLCLQALHALGAKLIVDYGMASGVPTYQYWNSTSLVYDLVPGDGEIVSELTCVPVLYIIGTKVQSWFVTVCLEELATFLSKDYPQLCDRTVKSFTAAGCDRHHASYPVMTEKVTRTWQLIPMDPSNGLIKYDLEAVEVQSPTTSAKRLYEASSNNVDSGKKKDRCEYHTGNEGAKRRRISLVLQETVGPDDSTYRCHCGLTVVLWRGMPWYWGFKEIRCP